MRNDVCKKIVECSNVDLCDAGCLDHYRCKNGSCADISTLCNGELRDGCEEDREWISGPGFKCVREGKRCYLPQQLIMDGLQDCDDGQDLCFEFNDQLLNERQVIKIYFYRVTFVRNFLLSQL